MKLWDKGYELDKKVEVFTVGEDYVLDQRLVFWDCVASIAHAMMLHKIEILTEVELTEIKKILLEIIELKEKFVIKQEQEDSHTAIEEYLTAKIQAGKKIHTGRSRNDQVLVCLKLFMKKELLETQKLIMYYCEALLVVCKHNVMFPGYTHMQKAMPSSVSLWCCSYIESMLDNLKHLKLVYDIIDTCPLGSGAGYGVPLDINRNYVAKLLGFKKTQNILYAQNARGKNEAQVVSTLMQIMFDINKIATDMLLFSTTEFNYFSLPKEFCTGSSIMPQKKNPDVLELVRAKSHVVASNYYQIAGIIQNLVSGYNRDFQLTKKPLIEAFDITKSSLDIMTDVLMKFEINTKACEQACTKELFATHSAYEQVKKGIAFRDAYKIADKGNISKKIIQIDREKLASKLQVAKNNIEVEKKNFENCIQTLLTM